MLAVTRWMVVVALLGFCLPSANAETLIYQTDFSSGLDGNWTTYTSDPKGYVKVGELGGESHALRMDAKGIAGPVLNIADLSVNLANFTNLKLRFDHYKTVDMIDAFPSGSFTGMSNSDGIAISVDGGANWNAVWTPPMLSNFWTNNIEVDLSAALLAHSLNPTANVVIRFQQFENFVLHSDGRGWDNIRVSGINAVPEPTTGMLLALGVACASCYRHRRRR